MIDTTTLVVLLLQSAIFVLFLAAVRNRDLVAVVNAGVALVLAVLPVAVELVVAQSISVGAGLPIWIGVAGLLHTIGMFGIYESVWWWDHLTHTVSAALVAALLYASLLVTLPRATGISGSSPVILAVTVASTLAIGLFWELLELVAWDIGERFGLEPVLVHYGWGDTAADIVFDIVGVLIVIGVDLRLFVPLAEQFPEVTEAVLLWSGWIVIFGSVVMAILVRPWDWSRA
jgi:hypothetical protein